MVLVYIDEYLSAVCSCATAVASTAELAAADMPTLCVWRLGSSSASQSCASTCDIREIT